MESPALQVNGIGFFGLGQNRLGKFWRPSLVQCASKAKMCSHGVECLFCWRGALSGISQQYSYPSPNCDKSADCLFFLLCPHQVKISTLLILGVMTKYLEK